jgi:hypothetical protein
MAKISGRIVAFRHDPDGGVMRTTTLFFADGKELTIAGVVYLALQMGTFEIRYDKAVTPHTLIGIKLDAG